MPQSERPGKNGQFDFSWMEILEHHFENENRSFMVFDAQQLLLYASDYARELLGLEEYRFQSTTLNEILPGLSGRLDKIRKESPDSPVTMTIDHYTPRGMRLQIELYWEQINDHKRSKEGSVIWLKQLSSNGRSEDGASKNAFLAMFNDLKIGYVQVNEEGYVQGYNEFFKTMLNLPGEWKGRNLFTYPPMHTYGIAPFLVRSLNKSNALASEVFPFGYPEINRELTIRWTKVPPAQIGDAGSGTLFCIQIEKNTDGLSQLLEAHRSLVESVSGFFQQLEPGFDRHGLLNLIREYWAEKICHGTSAEIIPLENRSQIKELPGLSDDLLNQDCGIVQEPGKAIRLFWNFQGSDSDGHLLFFHLPENEEPLLTDTQSLHYLHGILQKLYQKSEHNEKVRAERNDASLLSGKLQEKNRSVQELQSVLHDTNTVLQDKITRLEKQIIDLKNRDAEARKSHVHGMLQSLFQSMQQELSGPVITINTLLNDESISGTVKESVEEQLAQIENLLTGFKLFAENKPSDLKYIDINKRLENVILRLHRKDKILPRLDRHFESLPEQLYFPEKIDQVFDKLLRFFLSRDGNNGLIEIRSRYVGRLIILSFSNSELICGDYSYDKTDESILSHLPDQHGIDLFIIGQIIQDMRGEFTLTSHPDTGTGVTIRIPA